MVGVLFSVVTFLSPALLVGLVGAIVGGVMKVVQEALVGTTDVSFRKGAYIGTACGVVSWLGVLAKELFSMEPGNLAIFFLLSLIFCALAGGLVGGQIGIVFGGLQRSEVEMKTVPNQGIKLSIKNVFFGGLRCGLTFAVFSSAFGGLLFLVSWLLRLDNDTELPTPMEFLFPGLLVGLAAGVLAGLWYGGMDVIYHYVLRLFLFRKDFIPWRYSHFLDYAADELGFLQKVGGGYMFIHRYLLEYFAGLAESERPEAVGADPVPATGPVA